MTVITVSRQRGSMGSYVALEVARQLDLRYLDREIIQSVAQEAGVDVDVVQALEERAGQLARIRHLLGARPKLPSIASASMRERAALDERLQSLIDRERLHQEVAVARLESGVSPNYIPRLDYLELITRIILDQAAQDQAMIVGRGGQMILHQQPGVLHVQVVARFETRVYNIIKREGVKWREAAHRVRRSDEQRSGYLRRFYNVDWLEASLYDLVISTDRIPCGTAADLIVEAARALERRDDDEEE
ncbi:MAG: cytidylate kinase-like family protein [Anaerolineae bacterium]|jgi:cytidylate kinase